MLAKVIFQSRNFNMPIIQGVFLTIQLSIQISILLLSINQEVSLIVDFLSECTNHADVGFDSSFIVILHLSFIVGYPIEILF